MDNFNINNLHYTRGIIKGCMYITEDEKLKSMLIEAYEIISAVIKSEEDK